MLRFRPAFCFTLRPGLAVVPLADLVMRFTRRSSMATQPWLLVRSVVSLWGDRRNRSLPTLGRRTSAQRRDSLRTATAWPGNGIDRPAPRLRNVGALAGCSGFHQLSYARSS